MNQFRVGDKVRVVESPDHSVVGRTGVVVTRLSGLSDCDLYVVSLAPNESGNFFGKELEHVGGGVLQTQVSGDHYKGKAIQPIEYIHANGIGYMEGNVIKYVSRHQDKGGAADIRKAIHYLQIILELQYGEKGDGDE